MSMSRSSHYGSTAEHGFRPFATRSLLKLPGFSSSCNVSKYTKVTLVSEPKMGEIPQFAKLVGYIDP
jgi:hypothetical protein